MAKSAKSFNANPEMGKWYALIVLLLVLMVVYYLFFQGFVDEHSLMNEELADLQQERQEHTELSSQIPELQKRIDEVTATMGDNTNFLSADTYNLGTSELTRILKGIVAQNTDTSASCQTISNTPSKDNNPDQFERIILKVRMRCHFDKMIKVIGDIENNVPHLFVDNLQMEQRVVHYNSKVRNKVKPLLEVRFDLYAYMNKPIKSADNEK